ncbi:MAG: serine hydrolase [Candidatus Latescibacteria bacterium]|nr:serine hydrolase [Candidatus Latescibacterota bacterium]
MTGLIRRAILAGALLTQTTYSYAAAEEITMQPDFGQRVDALFAAYDHDVRPGFAIGIVRKGQLVLAQGYGYANLQSARPITPNTTFNIASLSKQFTAAALAREILAGRVSLEDRLADHWPDLPPFASAITLAHLVYMTSGLPEYYTLPSPKGGWSSESQFTVDDAITAVFAAGALAYAPGSRWTYSNINYQLLAKLVGRLNARTFADQLKTSVFDPLDMSTARVDAPLAQQPTDATAYYRGDLGPTDWHVAPRLSPHYGGSGVFASLRDLAQWDRALYQDNALEGHAFGELMLSTQQFEHDKANDAFGLVHGAYRGLKTIWYEGGDYGVSTYMARLPGRDETVICLANFADGRCYEKARAVMDLLIAFEPPSQ